MTMHPDTPLPSPSPPYLSLPFFFSLLSFIPSHVNKSLSFFLSACSLLSLLLSLKFVTKWSHFAIRIWWSHFTRVFFVLAVREEMRFKVSQLLVTHTHTHTHTHTRLTGSSDAITWLVPEITPPQIINSDPKRRLVRRIRMDFYT